MEDALRVLCVEVVTITAFYNGSHTYIRDKTASRYYISVIPVINANFASHSRDALI